MLEVLESIISLIVTLGILVTIHEYGHFWVARRCGVKVLKFSVGFGRPIWSWTDRHGTEFAVATIPLGGYVRMLDEREGPVPEELKKKAFNLKPVSQRIAIVSAGPVANFLFAIVAYWLMFLIGFNVLIPQVGSVDQDSPAHNAGLKAGVEIVSVDDTQTPGWRSVNMALINRLGETGQISFRTQYSPDSIVDEHLIDIDQWLAGKSQTDLLDNLGIQPARPVIPPVIGQVLVDSPAYKAGILSKDLITHVDGEPVEDWFSFVDSVKASNGNALTLTLSRPGVGNGSALELALSPELHLGDEGEKTWRVGVGVAPFTFPEDMIRKVSYGPLDSVAKGIEQTWADTLMTLKAIKKMLVGLVSLENLSGPITIAQVANESISSGLEDFLRFLALLSVSLGVLNLLPIPVLDGGHILYYSVEAIIGRPIPERWQVLGLKIGVSFILLLMTIAFYNDVMRLQ